MSSNVMDIIAHETNGKSYKTYKYTFEGSDTMIIKRLLGIGMEKLNHQMVQ